MLYNALKSSESKEKVTINFVIIQQYIKGYSD